jgi:hypothetical protein
MPPRRTPKPDIVDEDEEEERRRRRRRALLAVWCCCVCTLLTAALLVVVYTSTPRTVERGGCCVLYLSGESACLDAVRAVECDVYCAHTAACVAALFTLGDSCSEPNVCVAAAASDGCCEFALAADSPTCTDDISSAERCGAANGSWAPTGTCAASTGVCVAEPTPAPTPAPPTPACELDCVVGANETLVVECTNAGVCLNNTGSPQPAHRCCQSVQQRRNPIPVHCPAHQTGHCVP